MELGGSKKFDSRELDWVIFGLEWVLGINRHGLHCSIAVWSIQIEHVPLDLLVPSSSLVVGRPVDPFNTIVGVLNLP